MLETDLYNLLSTDASIYSVLNGANNVYLGAIPKGAPDSPAIVMQVTDTRRWKGADVTNQLTKKRVQFDSYHAQYSTCADIGNAVIALVKDLSGSLPTTNVQGVIADKDIDLGQEPGNSGMVFRRLMDFEFFYTDGAGSVPYTPIAPTVVGSNAGYIEGIPISLTAPTGGQGLVYNATTGKWEPGTAGGGGAGVNFGNPLTPSGAINGTNGSDGNAAFTWTVAPVLIFRNGVLQRSGINYTLAGAISTFIAPFIPVTGDSLIGYA